MPLNARLVVVGGEVKTAEIKLRLPTTIGRGRGSTIMLPHPLVSRQHCEIFEASGRLMVRDLGSLNGTFINNERISEAPLPTGELLTVGAVTFRAVYDVQEGSSPPAVVANAKTKVPDTDPNGTLRASDLNKTPPAVKTATDAGSDEVDFNFDEPLTPVDEGARVVAEPAALSKGADQQAALAKTMPAGPKAAAPKLPAEAAKPASPPVKPAVPAGAAGPDAAEDKPVNYNAWELEDKVDPKGESDDDFGDFLKSLGEK